MASPDHVVWLQEGVAARNQRGWNLIREQVARGRKRLMGADLSGATLNPANLTSRLQESHAIVPRLPSLQIQPLICGD